MNCQVEITEIYCVPVLCQVLGDMERSQPQAGLSRSRGSAGRNGGVQSAVSGLLTRSLPAHPLHVLEVMGEFMEEVRLRASALVSGNQNS